MAVPAGVKLTLINASASQSARLFASTLLSVGAVTDVHQLPLPGSNVFAVARRTMTNAPALVDIVHNAASYDPGYRTPNHVMNEFHLMIHTAGKVGYAYLDGGAESYPAGSQGIMYEGRPGWMRNDAAVESSMAWTWVANPGKPLSSAIAVATPAPAPAAPNTGTGPISSDRDVAALVTGLALVTLASATVAAKAAGRRRRNH